MNSGIIPIDMMTYLSPMLILIDKLNSTLYYYKYIINIAGLIA